MGRLGRDHNLVTRLAADWNIPTGMSNPQRGEHIGVYLWTMKKEDVSISQTDRS